jgi:flotillin
MLDSIFGFIQNAFLLVVLLVVALIIGLVLRSRYKVPNADQALVITGGKKGMRVLPGGGAFVSPWKKHQFFPLGVMTVRSDDQETQSSTLVPVIVQWTAQLRADVDTEGSLVKAARGFSSYEGDSIKESLKQTLDGEVRAVIAKMTPEDVVRDKVGFSTQVSEGVMQRMTDLGFELVSLNIADVYDKNDYYRNASAEDRENQRKRAEKLTADANMEVAVAQANADETAKAAEQKRDLAVAEQQRDLRLRQAAIQGETDRAQVDAEVAGELQREARNQDLATRRGEVAVVEEQQRKAAAEARRAVELTEAETTRQRVVIDSNADKDKAEIKAQAEARQSEIAAEAQANVAKRAASGQAEAAIERAKGEADALNLTADAEANKVRKTGLAEAEVQRAQGEAEASAILARGEAEAEVQRKMAEALAANDGANLRVTLAEIQRDTTVKIYTTVGEAMARVGEHATFIDMGGSGAKDGDLLSGVLGNIPQLLKQLNVSSEALHGVPFGSAIGSVISGIKGDGGNHTGHVATPGTDVVVSGVSQATDKEPAAEPAADAADPSGSTSDDADAEDVEDDVASSDDTEESRDV